MSQTNTKSGAFQAIAAEDLTGKEDRLVVLGNASGVPKVSLPNDVADATLYILIEGGAAGDYVTIEPLGTHKQFRASLDGTCVTGDRLTLAAINGTKDGQVVKLPASADTYFIVGRAEESGAAGQLVKFRATLEGTVTIT